MKHTRMWGRNRVRRLAGLAGALLLAAGLVAPAPADPVVPMADEPDPSAFVKRADSVIALLGAPQRFGGADIPWLGLRRDGGGAWVRTTPFEVRDALLTLRALGGTVARAATLAGTAGCDLCVEPTDGSFPDSGFAALDEALKIANDQGIRLILPLAGGGGDCRQAEADPASICAYLRWQGRDQAADFFTDPAIRAAFLRHVRAVLMHVNALTGVAYRNDPAIMAWENCVRCGAGADAASVGAWTEAVGEAIKAVDQFHLYDNNALAGRIGTGRPNAAAADQFAPPSVDIVSDNAPAPADEVALRQALADASGAVSGATRIYAIEGFDWGPGLWTTQDKLHLLLNRMIKIQAISVGLFGGLQGHADQGGFIPAQPDENATPLYFPGIKTPAMSSDEMTARALALRHFDFDMTGVQLYPAVPLPPKPQIISVEHGKVVWRGSAGAATYSVERSPDPAQPFSWDTVCDQCAGEQQASWQDPAPPASPAFYRVMPYNMNGHKALPSAPERSH